MTRSFRASARGLAALAAASTVGAMLPVFAVGGIASAAAASCTPLAGLKAYDTLDPTHYYSADHPSGTGGALQTLALSWNSVLGAAYNVQISPNEDFTNNLTASVSGLGAATWEVPETAVPHAGAYFWRVQLAGSTCWSDDYTQQDNTAQFAMAPLGAPTGLATSDAGNATIPINQLRLHWTTVTGASTYEVQLYNEVTGDLVSTCYTNHNSLSSATSDIATTATDKIDTQCIGQGTLYTDSPYSWRVRALDGASTVAQDGAPYGGFVYSTNQAKGLPADTFVGSTVQVTSVVNTDADSALTDHVAGIGDTLDVRGAGFTAGSTVTVNGATPTTTTFVSSTELKVVVDPTTTAGIGDVVVTTGTHISKTSSYDRITLAPVTVKGEVDDTFDPKLYDRASAYVAGPDFTLTAPDTIVHPANYGNAPKPVAMETAPDGTLINCLVLANECDTSPTITWSPVAGATSYRVTLFGDTADSQGLTAVDTDANSWTIPADLLDNQAFSSGVGSADYGVEVRACFVSAGCTGVDSGQSSDTTATFRKHSDPAVLTSPAPGTSVTGTDVTLRWADYAASSHQDGSGAALSDEAALYNVQVSSDCSFSTNLATLPATDHIQETIPTPATPGTYYWRVQAVDGSGSPLTWGDGTNRGSGCSGVRTFSVPAPESGTGGSAPIIGGSAGTAPKPLTVQAGDKIINKSGTWVNRKAKGAQGGTALVTPGNKKQALTLTFERGSVTVGYCVGPMDGYFSIAVDGKTRKTINTHAAFTTCGKTFTVKGLNASTVHKLLLQASDKKGFAHGSTQVALDYVKVA